MACGRQMEDMSLEEMDALWEQAKRKSENAPEAGEII